MAETTYYVRAYATNGVGTAYGEQQTFTTPSGLPSVQTAEEVTLTGSFTVDDNGSVSGEMSVVPVGQGIPGADHDEYLTLNGQPSGASAPEPIVYSVTYDGPNYNDDHDDNVREFNVTNEPSGRPPVKMVKEDWSGNPLSSAVFRLIQIDGSTQTEIGTFTSGTGGLIGDTGIFYLDYGKTYILTETKAPKYHVGMPQSLTITVGTAESGGQITVSPASAEIGGYYTQDTDPVLNIPLLTIKNRPFLLKVLKVDKNDMTVVLPGAVFKLLKGTTVGQQTEYSVMTGYDALTTDADGYLTGLPETMDPGKYALQEVTAPSGYTTLSGTIYFTVSDMGIITLDANTSTPSDVTLDTDSDDQTEIVYTVIVPDTPLTIRIKKVDETRKDLVGARFHLNRKDNQGAWAAVTECGLTGGAIDLTGSSSIVLTGLPNGYYQLVEDSAPNGYVIQYSYSYFRVNNGTVTLTDANGSAITSTENCYLEDATTIAVINFSGAALPSTGSSGAEQFRIAGATLAALAALGVFSLRRRREEDQ